LEGAGGGAEAAFAGVDGRGIAFGSGGGAAFGAAAGEIDAVEGVGAAFGAEADGAGCGGGG